MKKHIVISDFHKQIELRRRIEIRERITYEKNSGKRKRRQKREELYFKSVDKIKKKEIK